MQLPYDQHLPIQKLSGLFLNTSATYKFYWFIAILEAIEQGKSSISKKELFARMIAGAWYTVNYFHVSFGKQDLLQKAINTIKEVEQLSATLHKEKIVDILLQSENKTTITELWHFNKNVPHWFLTPWFNKANNQNDEGYKLQIYNASKDFDSQCLYALYSDYIEINPEWLSYLITQSKILKDFCLWNLTAFLQTRNPSVPDISGKLVKPPFRESLNLQRKQYWDIVFKEIGYIKCIFSGAELNMASYALDHFIPHSFVSHNLIWNLVPIEKRFNSIKSDKLPTLERYFDSFVTLHQEAYEIVKQQAPQSRFLEEYCTAFPEISVNGLDVQQYRNVILPLHTLACNNGFELLRSTGY